MAEERAPQTARVDEEPGKRTSLRSRLWARTGFGEKTLWDLLQLLIVPLALVAIGFWFTVEQEERQREIETKQAQLEREIEAQRAEQVTLQAYLDQMGTLLLDRDPRAADENSDVRRLARARTLVVLDALGPTRQERALRFLSEAELIEAAPPDEQPVIPLKYASLENIELPYRLLLSGANLGGANLKGARVTYEQLAESESLEGATMPDGTKHP